MLRRSAGVHNRSGHPRLWAPALPGTTATANDMLITGNEQVFLNVQSFTHIAYLQETAATIINITPLEAG
jgi:hypothetical protein